MKRHHERETDHTKLKAKIGPGNIIKLQSAGISTGDIQKLIENGIYTIEALVRTPKRILKTLKGLGDAKIDKMLKEASKFVQIGFQAASAILDQRREMIKITTGSRKLDEILHGGIEAGSITEIFGEYRCGKTQLCHTVAVTCQLPVVRGGGEGKCIYIDTDGSFRPERIMQIATRLGLNPEESLSNIAYARAYNTDHQTQTLVTAASLMVDSRFSLIIVDSATSLFRSEFNGRGELNARQVHLGQFFRALRKLADEFCVGVVATNQVVASNFDNCPKFTGPCNKAIGGNIVAHSSTTRISMTKGKGSTRKVKIISSPSLPEKDTEVSIGSGGIDDAQVKELCEKE